MSSREEGVMRSPSYGHSYETCLMIGKEDRILNTWARFVKKYGFLPLIGDGSTKIAPVYVVDFASAIIAALKDDGTSMGKVYELDGPEIYTVHDLAEHMFDTIREWPRYVKVSFPIAKDMLIDYVLKKKDPISSKFAALMRTLTNYAINWCSRMKHKLKNVTQK